MQSLDYKLKTSNTSYVTARHDAQYFPSSLSSFSPTTSRVCRIPLTIDVPLHRPRVHQDRLPRQEHGRHQPAGPGHAQPRLLRPVRPGLRQRPALRRHQLLRPHRGRARPAEGQRVQPQQGHGGFRRVDDPRIARAAATRTCCCAPPWWASCAAGRCCRRS